MANTFASMIQYASYSIPFILKGVQNVLYKQDPLYKGLAFPAGVFALDFMLHESKGDLVPALLGILKHHYVGSFLFNEISKYSSNTHLILAASESATRCLIWKNIDSQYCILSSKSLSFIASSCANQMLAYQGYDAILGNNIISKFLIKIVVSAALLSTVKYLSGESDHVKSIPEAVELELLSSVFPVNAPFQVHSNIKWGVGTALEYGKYALNYALEAGADYKVAGI